MMADTLRDKLIKKGWVTPFNADTLVRLIEEHYADEPAAPEGKKPTRDELWELWLRLNNELPDRPAAVAEFWEHAQIDARARAALADEPAVPEGREPVSVVGEPSDEDLLELAAAEMNNAPNWEEPEYSYEAGNPFPYEAPGVAWVNFARAVLSRWGNPMPVPLADGDVAELVDWLEETGHLEMQADAQEGLRYFRTAELLQRQALVPEAAAKPRKCLIEPPSWCDDGQAHAWQAGWEARDEMLLQPWPPGVGK